MMATPLHSRGDAIASMTIAATVCLARTLPITLLTGNNSRYVADTDDNTSDGISSYRNTYLLQQFVAVPPNQSESHRPKNAAAVLTLLRCSCPFSREHTAANTTQLKRQALNDTPVVRWQCVGESPCFMGRTGFYGMRVTGLQQYCCHGGSQKNNLLRDQATGGPQNL